MSAYMSRELLLFAKAFWYGALLVLLYGQLQVFRSVVRHGAFAAGLEDLIYWIFCALFLFSRCFAENSGVLRLYLGAGAAAGGLACRLSVAPLAVRFFTFLWKKLLRILKIPFIPVKKVIKRLKSKGNRGKLVGRNLAAACRRGRRRLNRHKGEGYEKKKKYRQKKGYGGSQTE